MLDWARSRAYRGTQRFGAAYPAMVIPGNNLWPLKLASVLYNAAASASSAFALTLHTLTPVTAVSASTEGTRRWTVHTPRGDVRCGYVLHATNGYAARLLPWMHGPDGIVPTRGQVAAVRATVPDALGRSGFVGNDGFEYWFPRPNNDASARADENQLVIVGGGREAKRDGKYEFYETDDSVVDAEVGEVLRKFLPSVFPGKFDSDTNEKSVEMEWVRADVSPRS